MDLKNFKDKLFTAAQAAGLEEYELYCKRKVAFEVSIFEGEIDEYKNERSFGVCFRGKVNGKMGYAFSEKIDDGVIAFLVESVKQNASIIEDEEEEFIYPGDATYPEVVCYNPKTNEIPTDAKIEAAIKMERATLDVDEKVDNVPYCALDNTEVEVYIANSKGLDVGYKSNRICGVVEAQVEGEDEQVKTAYDGYDGLDFTKFDPVAIGQSAAKKALAMLGASPVPSAKYPVVFEAKAASEMLETWVGAFSAEKAHKGFSILAGKLNEKIAADCVTIIDDPLLAGQEATVPFDSEGVASRTKTVIENGTFKTFLHNTKTARKDGVAPTGNGLKSAFNAPVTIGGTNFFIKPSTKTKEDLYTEVGDGLLITSFAGIHAGANPVSGEFSLQASGFVIKDGKKDRPIELITASGNFFTLLTQVSAVANDLSFCVIPNPNGNIASPSLLIQTLDIAGN